MLMSQAKMISFLGLLWLTVCSSGAQYEDAAALLATKSTRLETVQLHSIHPDCAITYNVLLYDAQFQSDVKTMPQNALGTTAIDPDAAVTFGVFELQCGDCTFRSKPTGRRMAHSISDTLIPVEHFSDFAVSAFLASSLIGGFKHSTSKATNQGLRGMVILNHTVSDDCMAALQANDAASALEAQKIAATAWNFASSCVITQPNMCTLNILPPEQQASRKTKATVVMPSTGAVISGRIAFDDDGVASPIISPDSAQLMEAMRIGRSILRSAFPALYARTSESTLTDKEDTILSSSTKPMQHSNTDGSDSRPHRHSSTLNELHATVESLDAAFLQTESTATAAESAALQNIPGLDKMLNPIMDGLLKPVVGLVAGTLGDVVGDALTKLLSSTVDSGMTSEIVSVLSHALPPALTESLVPPLTQSLVDSIPNTLGPMLRDAVAAKVTSELTRKLSDSLSETLADSISASLETDVPAEVSHQLTKELTYLLTQSVTQSVVPALMYTLHHSPADDFFCAYCKQYQLYCNYCKQNGPDELYRAEYYAAYYSRYYAEQFSKQYDQDEEEED